MGEEFHAAIKLVTGEEIFSLVCVDENDGDPIILLMNPVIMKVMRNHVGQYVKVKPWMEIASDSMYVVKYDKIVTMTEVKETKMIEFYDKYLNEEDTDWEEDGRTKITDKMGYVSSVKDAREMLEKLYKLKGSKLNAIFRNKSWYSFDSHGPVFFGDVVRISKLSFYNVWRTKSLGSFTVKKRSQRCWAFWNIAKFC